MTGCQHGAIFFLQSVCSFCISVIFKANWLLKLRISRNLYRSVFAALLLVAFFIPAYGNISALDFLRLAIGVVNSDAELTLFDLVIVSLPLLLIPFAAGLILVRSLRKKGLNGLLLGLPFFSLLFFILLLSFDMNRHAGSLGVLGFLKELRIGFYLAGVASLLLLFSFTRSEAIGAR